MGIKLYLDTAAMDDILHYIKSERVTIDGVTTNPSLMRKSGVEDYRAYADALLPQLNGLPVSFEVFADEFDEMERQALEIATWGDNIYVKIPVLNTQGRSTAPVIASLLARGVKLNITAVFTQSQVDDVLAVNNHTTPVIVSVFAGRIANAGVDPEPIVASMARSLEGHANIELLWASTREAFNIVQAERTGCHIITVPPSIIRSMDFGKDLMVYSQETVQVFYNDATASGFSIDVKSSL